MASTSGSQQLDTRSGSGRGDSGGRAELDRTVDSQDPDVLVALIESTREDLAHTIDQIADKVSPSRVAARTKSQASEAGRSIVTTAKSVAADITAVTKAKALEVQAQIKAKADEAKAAAAEAGHTVAEATHSAVEGAQHALHLDGGDDTPKTTDGTGPVSSVALVPSAVPRQPRQPGPSLQERLKPVQDFVLGLPRETQIGGGVALLVLFWLLRRERD